jgi:hypothetical protein
MNEQQQKMQRNTVTVVLQWFSKLVQDSIGAAQPSHAGEFYQTFTTFSIRIAARESTPAACPTSTEGEPPSVESYMAIFLSSIRLANNH